MSDTNVQGFVQFTDGSYAHLFGISTGGVFTDTTEAELYVRSIGGSQEQLWRSHEGKRIYRIALQAADGSLLTYAKIYDPKSGVVGFWRGNERNLAAVHFGHENVYDLDVKGLALPVVKGLAIKLTTAD